MGKRKVAKGSVPGKNAGVQQKRVKFNFKCDGCDRNFTDQQKLEYHQRIRHKTTVHVNVDNEEDFGFITLDREASIAATGAIPTNPTQYLNTLNEDEDVEYEDFYSNVQIGETPETPDTPTKLTDSVIELIGIGTGETRSRSKPKPRQTQKIKLPTPATPPSSSSDSEEETPPPAATTAAQAQEESQGTEDKLKCPICERELLSASAYKNHLEVHQGKRPFLCLVPDCQLGYPTEIDLLEHHSLRHSKERAFICEVCSKGYRSRNYLRSHQNRLGSQCKLPTTKRRYH